MSRAKLISSSQQIAAVCRAARLAHAMGEVLPVPDIVETGLSKVERRQLEWERRQQFYSDLAAKRSKVRKS